MMYSMLLIGITTFAKYKCFCNFIISLSELIVLRNDFTFTVVVFLMITTT